MAIGLAVTSGIYAIVNGVLLHPFPYRDQDRLATIWESSKDIPRFVVAPANFLDWKRQSSTFGDMAAIQQFKDRSFALTSAGEPEEIEGVGITWNTLDLLGIKPVEGRTLKARDGQVGHNAVALISSGLWLRKFGGAPSIVGRQVILNGSLTEIVGVLPVGLELPLVKADLFVPLAWDSKDEAERSVGNYIVIGRLRDGSGIEEARAELAVIARRIERQHQDTNTGQSVLIEPLYETVVGDLQPTLSTLFAAACLLLLLGSASASNVLLARFATRRSEVAIRRALGASRSEVVRQLLIETLLLSGCAGVTGLLLGHYVVKAFLTATPDSVYFSIPRRAEIGIDFRVFLFGLATSVFTGLLAGLSPAWMATKADINSLLREGIRGASSGRSYTITRRVLLGAQVALASLLVLATGLTVKSLTNLRGVNLGFKPDHIRTAQVSLTAPKYAHDLQSRHLFVQLMENLRSLPGVEAVSMVNFPPLAGTASMWSFHVIGQPELPLAEWPAALHAVVAPSYFETLGIPLRRGRYLTAKDNESGLPVVVISQVFADRYFKGMNPIGRSMIINDGGPNPRLVVGVVGDVRVLTLVRPPMSQVYVPFDQLPQRTMSILLSSPMSRTTLVSSLRSEIGKLDRYQPVAKIKPLAEVVANAGSRYAVVTMILSEFGFAAGLISVLAVSGMTAYVTRERMHEVSIRYALGARLGNLLKLLVRDAVLTAVVGTVAGLGLAWLVSGFLKAVLFGVQPRDPLLFTLVPIGTVLVCTICALISAGRLVRSELIDLLHGNRARTAGSK